MRNTYINLGILSSMFLILSTSNTYAQPGMYTEQDIETQNLYMEAQIAKIQGKVDEQIDFLKEVLKRDRKCHACHYEIAKAHFAKGKYEPSLTSIKKALAIDTDSEWYLLFQSEVQEKTEQYSAAAATLTKLIKMQADNPALYHRLALQQLASSQPEQAILTLRKLQDRMGVEEETSRRIFDIYSKSGKEKEAIAEIKKLIDSDPRNTRYLNNLASYYKKIGKDKEATDIYRRILELDPNDNNASFALIKEKPAAADGAAYLKELGSVISNMNLPLDNKIQELIPYLSKMKKGTPEAIELEKLSARLIELYPSDAKVYSIHGDVTFYNGNHQKALKNYKKAISIDDRKYTLWSQYLSCIWELGQHDKLLAESENAMDLYPNTVETYIYHAIALGKFNETQDASNILTEAGFIAGKNQDLRDHITIVKNWLEPNKADIAAISKIDISDNPSPTFAELIGDIYLANNDNSNAVKYWNRAIELGGNENRLNSKSPVK